MQSIFQYTEYRKYIKDYYEEKKQVSKTFSFEVFARKANIGSKGFLHHVMKGDRNLTRPVLLNVAKAMGLSDLETEYFEHLVSFDQAKSQREKDYCYLKILSYRQSVQARSLDDNQYRFYSEWYHSAIREILGVLEVHTPSEIARALTPPISAGQARESLRLMEELGLIRKELDGRYASTEPFITGTSRSVTKTAISNFQRRMCTLASEVWDRFSEDEFNMGTMTMSVSESLLPKIVEELRACRNRILTMVRDDQRKSTRVYQLNTNLFPLSHKLREKK